MKICLVNGSIRNKKSSSQYLLDHLEEKLDDTTTIVKRNWDNFDSSLPGSCDAFVFAFPLYMDSIPSNFLDTLEKIEKKISLENPEAKIYIMVNNAFYEAFNNANAVWAIKFWCWAAGLEFAGALAVGAGPIIGIAPLGTGPMKNLNDGLDTFAEALNQNKFLDEISDEEIHIEPNCDEQEYLDNANKNWTKAAEKRGLTDDDLRARL